MSWNISVTTVIGGGGNRPGIYAGKFDPNEFHDLPFLVKLPVGSLFLKTGEQNQDCTVGCAAGIYQKVCSDCGGSSWSVFDSSPPIVLTFTTSGGKAITIDLTQTGDTPIWTTGDGAVKNTKNLSHTYAAGSFNGSAAMFNGATEVEADLANLTALNVSGLSTALSWLYCYNNQLTTLDLRANTALVFLDCSTNQLTTVDLSANTVLTDIFFQNNPLTELDLSTNAALTYVDLNSTQLTALDLSSSPAVYYLKCFNSPLETLNVRGVTALTSLFAYNGSLTELDLSTNAALNTIEINQNLMPEAAVDQVLADVEAHGTSNGSLLIYGSNAAPSAAGLADVALLQGRGWTVTTS